MTGRSFEHARRCMEGWPNIGAQSRRVAASAGAPLGEAEPSDTQASGLSTFVVVHLHDLPHETISSMVSSSSATCAHTCRK
jgi:hypothetical protein